MKTYLFKTSLIIFMLTGLFFTSILPQNKKSEAEGIWQGTLKVSSIQLRIIFKIKKTTDGQLTATMDSPDQKVRNFPTGKVLFAKDSLILEMPKAQIRYSGKINSKGTTVEGAWIQRGKIFPLNLKKVGNEKINNRYQEPKKPYPYNSEDVKYENKKVGITLAGTFTYPKRGGPFTTVLLITGSGAQNRNEELLGHKPFLVLSDYLTRRGIAVLRVDDRGVGKSIGDFASATSKDFAGDALAGVEYLKTRKEVNKKEIGLIGHSEGGVIAPMVAVKSKNIAFIVLMAGTGLPGDQIFLKQGELIARAEGLPENYIRNETKFESKLYDIIKNQPDSIKAHNEILNEFRKYYNSLSQEERKKIGDTSVVLKKLSLVEKPWLKYFFKYDPAPVLEKVKCPVLAINGSKDLQVSPKENLAAIKKALTKGGNKDFKVVELKGLNHLFQTAKTGLPNEYRTIEQTIAPIALKTIGDWILSITKM
ncbi:MAG TPA: alpha/beta hydrolase [Ignavibacteriaceae bacterium]|nr:alpha/beta hydrolase [Ignavibacteriaceae bacterium]